MRIAPVTLQHIQLFAKLYTSFRLQKFVSNNPVVQLLYIPVSLDISRSCRTTNRPLSTACSTLWMTLDISSDRKRSNADCRNAFNRQPMRYVRNEAVSLLIAGFVEDLGSRPSTKNKQISFCLKSRTDYSFCHCAMLHIKFMYRKK